jgi:hypothetical protein
MDDSLSDFFTVDFASHPRFDSKEGTSDSREGSACVAWGSRWNDFGFRQIKSLSWNMLEPFSTSFLDISGMWVWVNTYRYILVGWTSIYQLFWGSLGTRVLTHPHVLERENLDWWPQHVGATLTQAHISHIFTPSLGTSRRPPPSRLMKELMQLFQRSVGWVLLPIQCRRWNKCCLKSLEHSGAFWSPGFTGPDLDISWAKNDRERLQVISIGLGFTAWCSCPIILLFI